MCVGGGGGCRGVDDRWYYLINTDNYRSCDMHVLYTSNGMRSMVYVLHDIYICSMTYVA